MTATPFAPRTSIPDVERASPARRNARPKATSRSTQFERHAPKPTVL